MQGRIVLNRNSNFQNWSGGLPLNWDTSASANTDVIQLDRHWPRGHPERALFPSQLKANDLVKDGDFALRLKDDGTGSMTAQLQSDTVPCAPGQLISLSMVYRYNEETDTFVVFWTFYDDLARTTTLWSVVLPPAVGHSGLPTPPRVHQLPGNDGAYRLAAGGGSEINLNEGVAGYTEPYWIRQGFQAEVPHNAFAMDVQVNFDSLVAFGALDLDDIRFEALDSVIHAIG